MKVNSSGRSKLGQRRDSWQRANHAWLYSDLVQTRNGAWVGGCVFSTMFALNRGDLTGPDVTIRDGNSRAARLNTSTFPLL